MSQIKGIEVVFSHEIDQPEFGEIIHYYQHKDTLFYAIRYSDYDCPRNKKDLILFEDGKKYDLGNGKVVLFAIVNGESYKLPFNNSYGKVIENQNFVKIELRNNEGISEDTFNKILAESNIYGITTYWNMFKYNIVETEIREQLPNAPPKIQKDAKGKLYAPVNLKDFESSHYISKSNFPPGLKWNNYFIVRIRNGRGDLYKVPRSNDREESLLGISVGNELFVITSKRVLQLKIKE
jgi:hypothetical protein